MFVTVYITVADYWKIKKDEALRFYSIKKRYERLFNDYVLPEIGMMKVADVTLTDIERVVRKIYSLGKSKSMVSMAIALLRKLFHTAATDRLVNEESLKGMRPIIWEKSERRAFTLEQEINLLRAFQRSKQPELYTLSMFTGIPYRDLAGCVVSDYSREKRTLNIFRKPKAYYAEARNASSKVRTIPISEISCRVIEFAIKKQSEKNKKFPGQESNLIFTDMYNMRVSRVWAEEYRRIRKLSGIFDFHMKDLISNFGVHALKQKVNPIVLKRYIGYKTDVSVNLFARACHNNVKDIQASDNYYRELMNNE